MGVKEFSVSCADTGNTCEFVYSNKSQRDTLLAMVAHLKEAHSVDVDEAVMAKILNIIKTVG